MAGNFAITGSIANLIVAEKAAAYATSHPLHPSSSEATSSESRRDRHNPLHPAEGFAVISSENVDPSLEIPAEVPTITKLVLPDEGLTFWMHFRFASWTTIPILLAGSTMIYFQEKSKA